MKPKTMETLAWVLIYAGGLLAIFGLAIFKSAESLAVAFAAIGTLSVVAECFLIGLGS
jgi:hypothetical protein